MSRPFARVIHELTVALAPYAPHIAGRLCDVQAANGVAEMTAYRIFGFVDGYTARSVVTSRQDAAMTTIRRLADELLTHCRERESRLSGAA